MKIPKGNWRQPLDPMRLLIFLLILVSVSRIHSHFALIGKLRPAMLLAVLTLGYAYLNPHTLARTKLLTTVPAKTIAAIGIWACLSTVFGISIGASGKFILDVYTKVLLTGLLIVVATRHGRDLWLFVWAYVISSGVLVWMAWFVFGMSKADPQGISRLSNLYTFDANDLGLVLLIGLTLSLLTFQTSGRLGKLISVVVILGVGATIARSGSRGGFVGLVAVALSLVFMMKTVALSKRLVTVGAIGIALALAAPPGYWQQMSTILEPKKDYNWSDTDGRKAVAKRGFSYMQRFPIFGLGINNFAKAECFLEEKGTGHIPGTGRRCTAPHNTWVQAGAELGFPGLVMWLVLTLGSVVGMNRLRRRLPKGWKRGPPEERFLFQATLYLPVAMISFMATSSFLSFAWVDIVYILAAFIAGTYHAVSVKLYGERLARRNTATAKAPRRPRRQQLVTARSALNP